MPSACLCLIPGTFEGLLQVVPSTLPFFEIAMAVTTCMLYLWDFLLSPFLSSLCLIRAVIVVSHNEHSYDGSYDKNCNPPGGKHQQNAYKDTPQVVLVMLFHFLSLSSICLFQLSVFWNNKKPLSQVLPSFFYRIHLPFLSK